MKNLLAICLLIASVLAIIAMQTVARRWLAVIICWLALLILVLSFHFALARDAGQWEATDTQVRDWYQTLMQPDNPSVSCCGEADAYWADSFEVDGDRYVAIITDTRDDVPLKRKHIDVGTRFVIPNHKLKYDQSNPTGHGVIFLSRGDYVYCYVAPGGV